MVLRRSMADIPRGVLICDKKCSKWVSILFIHNYFVWNQRIVWGTPWWSLVWLGSLNSIYFPIGWVTHSLHPIPSVHLGWRWGTSSIPMRNPRWSEPGDPLWCTRYVHPHCISSRWCSSCYYYLHFEWLNMGVNNDWYICYHFEIEIELSWDPLLRYPGWSGCSLYHSATNLAEWIAPSSWMVVCRYAIWVTPIEHVVPCSHRMNCSSDRDCWSSYRPWEWGAPWIVRTSYITWHPIRIARYPIWTIISTSTTCYHPHCSYKDCNINTLDLKELSYCFILSTNL